MRKSDFLFLLEMDATREMRTMERPQIRQMYGYRNEWNRYCDNWIEENNDWR